MHHADMLLRRTDIAGILESNPRVAGFKQHGQHLAPQTGGLHRLEQLDLTAGGAGFIGGIGDFEITAEQIVQVLHIGGRKQRPAAAFHDALHEQVRNPVGGIHVVRTATVVPCVLAQIEKLLDIQMPGFQIGAHRAFALAALVYRHRCIVHHLEERHHTLRFAIGALDVSTQRPHRRPVIAQPSGKLGKQRIFLDGIVNTLQIILHRRQITGRQL